MSFRTRMIGAWSLVSYCAINSEDPQDIIYPIGEGCSGQIIYSKDGYMAAMLQAANIEPFEHDWKSTTATERAHAAKNTIAYCGPFHIEEIPGNKQTVQHHVKVSLVPNWIDTLQIRRAELSTEGGLDYLTLGPNHAVELYGVQRILRLKWQKLPENNAPQPPAGIPELKL